MSKEHHPDVNKSKQSHSKFLEINEAYNVLGKPETRRSYDLGLAIQNSNPTGARHYGGTYYNEPFRNPYHDPLFWANRDRSKDDFHKSESYYGINGIPRLPNGTIVMACIIFAMIGIGVQYLAITKSFTFRRDRLIKKSQEAERMLNESRQLVSNNGNNVQLEALKMKLGKVVNDK